MGQDQPISANESTVSARLPRLERAYQRAASIRDRVKALKAPARLSIPRSGTRAIYYGAIVAMIGVLALIGAATLPTLFGYHTYAINGGSMEPTLKLGSAAVTKPTSPFALEIGDVISRHDDGKHATLHRIVDIITVDGERQFITQGDQNRTPDAEPVVLTGFGDKVVYSVPYAGYLLNMARSWWGRFLLLGVPAAFVVATSGRRLRSKWRERQSESAATESPSEIEDAPVAAAAAVAEPPIKPEDTSPVSEELIRQSFLRSLYRKAALFRPSFGKATTSADDDSLSEIEEPEAGLLIETAKATSPEASEPPTEGEATVATDEDPVELVEATTTIEEASATDEADKPPAAVEGAVVEATPPTEEAPVAPEADGTPAAVEDAVTAAAEAPAGDQAAPVAELPAQEPEAEDAPAAVNETVAEATVDFDEVEIPEDMETLAPLTPIETALPELPPGVEVPDSPFPIEAAYEAKANAAAAGQDARIPD
jgi:signal peptidase